ncbi:MAG TPA: hemolysin family protein [Aliidongia sp.]|uniref:hemolysin family protein n=1 Tax=Aliidongia sp. TaxID=1914230 RepID=UPI002DDDB325|nr:hemolysin family protein [Aliidongia sp.]HEV2673965.1 hemolysin family protein [Aliidongia sp.]
MTDASYPKARDGEQPTLWDRFKRWTSGAAAENDDPDAEGTAAFDSHERALIENVLKLRDLAAWDVMVPRVDIVAVDLATPFADVVKLLIDEGHSRLPVYEGDLDHVVGMIHVKDVLGYVAAGKTAPLPRLLRKALFVAPSSRVLDLLSQMRQQRVHMAFVVDEFGGIDGLITIEDLVEEIVGDIEDEHDETEPAHILERADGSLIVDARTPIEELETALDIRLLLVNAEEEVDTVGGLIFMLAGHVPLRGERIEHPSGIVFEVLDADQRRLRRLRVRRAPKIEPAGDDI